MSIPMAWKMGYSELESRHEVFLIKAMVQRLLVIMSFQGRMVSTR